jgi:hypothetical protein
MDQIAGTQNPYSVTGWTQSTRTGIGNDQFRLVVVSYPCTYASLSRVKHVSVEHEMKELWVRQKRPQDVAPRNASNFQRLLSNTRQSWRPSLGAGNITVSSLVDALRKLSTAVRIENTSWTTGSLSSNPRNPTVAGLACDYMVNDNESDDELVCDVDGD